MRRIIGPTGSPQVIPRMTGGFIPSPLIDLTSEDAQEQLANRTILVDLWAYVPGGNNQPTSSPFGQPPLITGMVGLSTIRENFNLALQKSFCITAPVNDFTAAASNPDRRIAKELTGIGSKSLTDVNQLVASNDVLSPGFPCRVLERFPISGPFAMWFIHNYVSVTVYVWGYYTIEGDDEDFVRQKYNRRPLQPSLTQVQNEYLSVRAEPDGVPVTVHQVSSDFVDEVTIQTRLVAKVYGGSGISGPGTPYRSALTFENPGGVPVSMPIWDKGDVPAGTNGDQQMGTAVRTWLDGIPMRGAGKIEAVRIDGGAPENTYATSVRGSFIRY